MADERLDVLEVLRFRHWGVASDERSQTSTRFFYKVARELLQIEFKRSKARMKRSKLGKLAGHKRARTAYHEAGHAVVAIVARLPIQRVSIVPEDESLGHVLYRKFGKKFESDLNVDLATERTIRGYVQSCFGGELAARLACGRASGYHSDMRKAWDMVGYLGGAVEIERLWFRLLRLQTEATLKSRWPSVEALAAALLEEQTIPGRRARRIVLEGMLSERGKRALKNLERSLKR